MGIEWGLDSRVLSRGIPTGEIGFFDAPDHEVSENHGAGVLFQLDREHGDDEAKRLWLKLKPKIPEFFSGLDVKPSLLHGDLWSGNAGQADGRPGKA